YKLHYWTSKYTAELDFILQKEDKIIGIEVKKGEHTKSKSLNEFIKIYSPDEAIRLSLKNFGKSQNIISIPLYAAFCC
ncbi:MAG: ATPase, partial [Clostridiales bacterium]